jgi:hypothetical protein
MSSSLEGFSKNESIKAASKHLRGHIKDELVADTPAFDEESTASTSRMIATAGRRREPEAWTSTTS